MNDREDIVTRLCSVGKCDDIQAGFTCFLQQVNLDIAGGEFVTIMDLSKKLNTKDTTMIAMTHNEKYAASGRCIIQLKDSWLDGKTTPVRPSVEVG